MNSLKDVYGMLNAVEKQAAEQANPEVQAQQQWDNLSEQEKLAYQQAQDYDQVGRVLAHQVWDELVKTAAAVQENNEQLELRQAILQKMAEDPNYVAALIAKHQHLFQ